MSQSPRDLTRSELSRFSLPPYADSDKTGHGYVVVIAGSRYTPGSASLATSAAMRSGVGQVTVITVESTASALSIQVPEAKVVPIAEGSDGGFTLAVIDCIAEHVKTCGGVVAGPGMADDAVSAEIARTLLGLPMPVILDAALIYSLPKLADNCRKRETPAIILPHKVEMAALLGCSEEEAERDPAGCARRAADGFNALVLAKGPVSHIAAPDGRSWVHRGGAPGLGVAGSGDTLAGIIGALLARGAEPLTALLWGVLVHGEAGELLSTKIGPVGFFAREIPDEIPALLAR